MDSETRDMSSSQNDNNSLSQPTNVVVTSSNLSQVNLTLPVDYNKISDLKTYVMQLSNEQSSEVNRYKYITGEAIWAIEFNLISKGIKEDHREWSNDVFFSHLLTIYNKNAESPSLTEESFIQKFKEVKMKFDVLEGVNSLTSYSIQLKTLLNNMNSFKVKFTSDNERSTVDSLLKNFPKFPKYYTRLRDKILAMGRPSTIETFITNLAIQAGLMVACYQEVREGGAEIRFPQGSGNLDKGIRLDNKKRKHADLAPSPTISKLPNISLKCDGCGGKNHIRADCLFNTHPDYNIDTSCDWATSDKGKAWKQQRGLERLTWHVDSLDGTFKGRSNPSYTVNNGRSGSSGPKILGNRKNFQKRKNRESLLNITISNNIDHANTLLPTIITFNNVDKHIESLIDTGAF